MSKKLGGDCSRFRGKIFLFVILLSFLSFGVSPSMASKKLEWPRGLTKFCKLYLNSCVNSCIKRSRSRFRLEVALLAHCQVLCWNSPGRRVCHMTEEQLLALQRKWELKERKQLEADHKVQKVQFEREQARKQKIQQASLIQERKIKEHHQEHIEEKQSMARFKKELKEQTEKLRNQKKVSSRELQRIKLEKKRLELQRKSLAEQKKRLAIEKQLARKRADAEKKRRAEEAARLAKLEAIRKQRLAELEAIKKLREAQEARLKEAKRLAAAKKKLEEERKRLDALAKKKRLAAAERRRKRRLRKRMQRLKRRRLRLQRQKARAKALRAKRIRRLAALKRRTRRQLRRKRRRKDQSDPIYFFRKGDADKAYELFAKGGNKGMCKKIKSFLSYYRRGRMAHNKRNADAAISALERSFTLELEIGGGEGSYRSELGQMLANMHVYKGVMAYNRRYYAIAFRELSTAKRYKSSDRGVKRNLKKLRKVANRFYERALDVEVKDPTRSKFYLKKAIQLVFRTDPLYNKCIKRLRR